MRTDSAWIEKGTARKQLVGNGIRSPVRDSGPGLVLSSLGNTPQPSSVYSTVRHRHTSEKQPPDPTSAKAGGDARTCLYPDNNPDQSLSEAVRVLPEDEVQVKIISETEADQEAESDGLMKKSRLVQHEGTKALTSSWTDRVCCLKGCCLHLLGTVPVPRWALLAAVLLVIITAVAALATTLGPRDQEEKRDPLIAAVSRPSAPCPDQWMWYGGKCYMFSKESKSWDASHMFCSSHNATLSIIGTLQVKEVITRFKDTKDYWIGLRKNVEGWRWVDGSPLRTDIIQLKNDGQGLNCAYINYDRLGALDCTTSRHWLCTKDGAELPLH